MDPEQDITTTRTKVNATAAPAAGGENLQQQGHQGQEHQGQEHHRQEQQQHQQPGLVSGHVQYVKGVAEDLVGSVTGSQPWKTSAAHDKDHAVESMRSAAAGRDPAAQGYGKVEEVAGRAVGCGGMQREGAASATKKDK